MIGLKRHTVAVVAHDTAWVPLYEEKARAIRDAAGGLILDVQHVGSTAVPGLPAKPILDIAIALSIGDILPDLVKRLVAIGYIDRGDFGREGGYLLVQETQPEVRSVHLHIVLATDSQWQNYIHFRDTLRRDAEIRERYANLKKALARRFPNDRQSYTNGKQEFIQEILLACDSASEDYSDGLSADDADGRK